MGSVLSLAKQLIQIPSVSDDIDQLHKCIDFLQRELTNGNELRVQKVVYRDKPSLLVQNFDGKWADIVLNGHIDVVPAASEEQFTPYEANGKLYGRGAGDMKAGVAIMVELCKELAAQQFNDKKRLLMLTADEEIGGFDGVQQLVADGRGGDIVLIPDGGATDRLVTTQKGVYITTIQMHGKQAHSSRPWLGRNALHDLIEVYQIIKAELEDHAALWESDDHRATSVSFNMIDAGSALNIVPDRATGTIDIRYTEHYSRSHIQAVVDKALNGYTYTIQQTVCGGLLYTEPGDPDIDRYAQLAGKQLGRPVLFEKEHGGSDGRFFSQAGSKVILHRPTCDRLHQGGERVDISSLEQIYTCFKAFVVSNSSHG